MLNYLWFPLLDRLYRQVPNIWTYLQAKDELDTVDWRKVYVSKYNYTGWSVVNGQLWNGQTWTMDKKLLAISSLAVLAVNGEQYIRTNLGPIKRQSLIDFILPYRISIVIFSTEKINELRRRLHEFGAKHKFRILEVSQVCITLQLRPPSVLMNMIYQVINDVATTSFYINGDDTPAGY